jgi:hypothetical protein
MSSRRRKRRKTNKRQKNSKPNQNGNEELRKAQKHKKFTNSKTPPESTPSNTLNTSSPSYIDIIMLHLSTTLLARVQPTLCPILSPLGTELIKHKPREE